LNTNKQVSIQLALDGHSFSIQGATHAAAGRKADGGQATGRLVTEKERAQKPISEAAHPEQQALQERMQIEVLTAKSVLVPQVLFAPEDAASLLTMQGVALTDEEVILTASDPQHNDAVAVMAVPRTLQVYIAEHYGDEVRYTTPLLHVPTVLEPTIYLCDTGSLIYIKVYEPHLTLAEVVAATDADVEFLLHRLAMQLDAARFVVHLELRHRNKQRAKSYKQYFKKIVCV